VYIKTVAFPSLRLGKRIDAEDWRLLFLGLDHPQPRGRIVKSGHRHEFFL
jgi:hypothetical protein